MHKITYKTIPANVMSDHFRLVYNPKAWEDPKLQYYYNLFMGSCKRSKDDADDDNNDVLSGWLIRMKGGRRHGETTTKSRL